MRAAIPFHLDMQEYFGEHAVKAERELWVGSIALGAFACKLVYDLSKEYSPIYFGEAYTKLTKAKQVEWDNRTFSTAHAIFCSLASGYLLWISDVFRDEMPLGPVAFRSTIFSYFTIAFSTGYFLADLAMIVWKYPTLGGPEYVRFLQRIDWGMVLHHLLSIGSVVLANYAAHAHIYILLVLFTEISTPFINMRWYLMISGMKNSNWYLYNGLALLVVWLSGLEGLLNYMDSRTVFEDSSSALNNPDSINSAADNKIWRDDLHDFARVLLFVYFFYHIYLHFDQVSQLYEPGFYFLFTAPPGLALMNLFWFYKIVIGATKAVFRNKRE